MEICFTLCSKLMGTKRSMQSLRNGSEEKLSVPPGFVSLTSLTLKRTANGSEEATDDMATERIDPLSKHAIKKFKTSFSQRPWILHNQFDCALQNDNLEETEVDTDHSLRVSLPKGVFRGCASCHDCVKVTARWHPKESCLPVLDDAPVFHPTEEEFKDPMKYISKIRVRAEKYGICRIVPPPSWRPPCLLEDIQTWKEATFNTHIQKIDGLKNFYVKRKLSRTMKKFEDKRPKVSVRAEHESLNGRAELKQANCVAVRSDFESGPEHTLQSFKKYADDFKNQYFCKNDEVTDSDVNLNAGHKNQGPLIARLEGEYWRIIENPSEEIEVLYGTDMESRALGSGFPIKSCLENKVEHSEYAESAWNLHNVPKLSSSLLPFGCDSTSAILVPQLFVGMCFTSQCWRNEDHHLYSLCYLHLGDPKVWHSIPGRYCCKYVEVAKKLCPELSEHPSIHELAYQLSPSMLKSEGIPVYRCVQNPREFILIFPGAYHTEFDCGFNCSESVCFAPFDWLPHGLNTVEQYNDFCRKSSISFDRLLIGAAIEAVNAQWETLAIRNDSAGNQLWKSVCGKDGLLTKALKFRVQLESIRRKHISNPSQSRVLDEADTGTKRECSVCLCDLYLSATCCSCSPDIYTCLRHAKQLCYCTSWADKIFLFRYKIASLESLVEALEGNLRAIHIWVKKKNQPIPDSCAMKNSLHQPDSGHKRPAATSMSPCPVSSGQETVQHSNPGTTILPSGRGTLVKSSVVPPDIVVLSDDEDEKH
ncbi:putative lysine-specific demethylase JMJ16 isoform X1 [Primulina tabacum]|uniref:putative lysine-specific demethylase JMJ16 isoform X1 n=2 Tax=Primulina tabacum TaxID=48773 RepID=UPI003F5A9D1A